jgi:predicted DNA-binding protein
MPMKRKALHLPELMIEKLKAVSKSNGLPVSEIVRRAVDDYLERFGKA